MCDKNTILAVDDTSASLVLLVKILTGEGYQVRPAESAELALASVAANPPDLILLDMRMPGMDGFEVLRRLKARAESSGIPVILVSANAEVEHRVEGLKLGAVDFVTKPFQAEELLARVRTQLELRRLRARLEQQALDMRLANEQLQSEIVGRQRVEDELHQNLDRSERSRRAVLSALEDQKRSEHDLLAAETRYRTLFNSANDIILLSDLSGRILQVNQVACERMEYSEAELVGKSLRDIDTPEMAERIPERIHELAASGRLVFESAHVSKNGAIIPVEVSARIVEYGATKAILSMVRDITERKRAEREMNEMLRRQQAVNQLQQSLLAPATLYEKLKRITESIVSLFDADFCRIWLIRPGDLCGQDCVHAKETEGPHCCRHRDKCLHLLASSGRYTHVDGKGHRRVPFGCYKIGLIAAGEEHKFITNDAQNDPRVHNHEWARDLGLVSFTGYQIRVPGGETLGVLALFAKHPILPAEDTMLDGLSNAVALVVQQANTEEARQVSETRYRRLFESAKDGILILDADTGQIVDVNPYLIELLGFDRENFMGRKLWEIGLFKDIASSEAAFVELQKKGYIRYDDLPLETRDGRRIDVEFVSNVYRVDSAKVIQCNIRNITERKRAEAEVRKLSTAISQSPVSVVITDLLGNIEYANLKFSAITGFSNDELLGQNSRLLKSGETSPEEYEILWKTITSGGEWRGEFHNKKKDGTLFWERASLSPIRNAAGTITHFLGNKEDITQQKSLEEQYRQAQKMEAIGQLAGGVAHDFNNILQAIVGYCGMLLDLLPEHDETHELAEEIANGADRAAALTRQLLAFSRRQILEMEDLELNEVVHGLTKMIRRIIGESIEVEVIEGGLGLVHADRGQMEQVLLNLCINARDAMPEGGALTIKTEKVEMDKEYCNAHAWATPGRYVLLSVTDTGCGMDAGTQTRIFEPFFTTKEVGQGTGLGLATAYGIVQQHQGMIQVYSEVDTGTTFKVYLPSVEHMVATVAPKVVERARGGTETILVAEDDNKLRELATRILEGAGYTVLPAADGKEALDVFEKHAAHIDLCLLDVMMPKMGGKAVYDALHPQNPRLRFLFSSGYSMDQIHKGFVLKKGVELIQKPYAPDALLRSIRQVLDETHEEGRE